MSSSPDASDIGRLLVVVGIVIAIVGLVVMIGPKIPFLGRLPGDIFIQRDGLTIIFPVVTTLLISVVLTIVLNVIGRFFQQ